MNQEVNPQNLNPNEQVVPPPFHQGWQDNAPLAPSATPSLAERIGALGIDEPLTQRIIQLTEGLDSAAASDELLRVIASGISHDEDVKNADAEGYLRGKNEKIETVMHPQPADDGPEATPVFPRYCRRSVWD